MGVYRKLKQPCACGKAQADWHACTCPRSAEFYVRFEVMGAVIQQKLTGITTEKEALQIELGMARKAKQGHGQELLDFMNDRKCRDTFCRIGEILDATVDTSVRILKEDKYAKRIAQALLLVLARALDLWTIYDGAAKTFGRKLGSQIADEARLRKLSASVLDGELVRKYFKAATGRLDWIEAFPENTSVNSTLAHARQVFSPNALTLKLAHLKLPKGITQPGGFLKHKTLPEFAPAPEPFEAEQFAVLVEAAEKLWGTPGKWPLAAINLALRQTGMRSDSLVHLHQSWLKHFGDDGWMMEVRKVKGGTAEYSIPVSDRLAMTLLAPGRPFTLWTGEPERQADTGYLLPGHENARKRALRDHTRWMKTLLPPTQSLSEQSNHRLRDTAAAICYSWFKSDGRKVSSEMLGNGWKVNEKHYAKLRINVSDLMKRELAHAQRLLHRPENVLPMVPQGKVA